MTADTRAALETLARARTEATAQLTKLAAARARRQQALDAATAELHDSIRLALEVGIGATEVAKLSGLSRARVYQVAEEPSAPQQT